MMSAMVDFGYEDDGSAHYDYEMDEPDANAEYVPFDCEAWQERIRLSLLNPKPASLFSGDAFVDPFAE